MVQREHRRRAAEGHEPPHRHGQGPRVLVRAVRRRSEGRGAGAAAQGLRLVVAGPRRGECMQKYTY